MSVENQTTLRLHMPQWQGGNVHEYYFGSQLLAWLAPRANGPVETVPVPEPQPGEILEVENGILARAARSLADPHRLRHLPQIRLGFVGFVPQGCFASGGWEGVQAHSYQLIQRPSHLAGTGSQEARRGCLCRVWLEVRFER